VASGVWHSSWPGQYRLTMPRKLFVNLPVKNLERSIDFFTQLGFEFNPQFTSENATSMIINDDAAVMLLLEDFYSTFTERKIADAATSEVILAITSESREEVDDLVSKALEAGATSAGEAIDEGAMYQRAFHDLDDHKWEVFWMETGTLGS
jgi:predicted lactoylglutathione lyase